ncbi:hypothetical protein QUB56_19385 [Microcoleus sp. AR_TQ3_B6]|uniref:hypothetical protein n=1 Tax=Microcoleus sp. AR_TQ3_B6 TaxID=3055284 RepID=UPI002FD6E9A9
MSRCSASAPTMEAEPPDMRYQALPGNEYNHSGLLYLASGIGHRALGIPHHAIELLFIY